MEKIILLCVTPVKNPCSRHTPGQLGFQQVAHGTEQNG